MRRGSRPCHTRVVPCERRFLNLEADSQCADSWPQVLAIMDRSAARPLLNLTLATTTSGLPSPFRSATAQSAAAGIRWNSVAQSSCDLDIKRDSESFQRKVCLDFPLRHPQSIESLAAFLRARLEPDDHIVIDDHNTESHIVAQARGLPCQQLHELSWPA